MLFTVQSADPSDLKVFIHSVVLILQTFTVPSEEALQSGHLAPKIGLLVQPTLPENIVSVLGENHFIYK